MQKIEHGLQLSNTSADKQVNVNFHQTFAIFSEATSVLKINFDTIFLAQEYCKNQKKPKK